MEVYENKSSDNSVFSCEFCNSTFTLKRNLVQHIKTSKKCIAKRPKFDIHCIWCKCEFINNEELDKHYKKCSVDKNIFYMKSIEECKMKDILLKEKDKEIERLNNLIKELSNNIKGDVTNNTTNTVTYNITLNCAKPLLLSKERVLHLMDRTCEPYYIKRGQEGLADWFLNDVCRNEDSEISIECTDKNRFRFRYEDENDVKKEIVGHGIISLLKGCIPTFLNTTYYNQTLDQAREMLDKYGSNEIYLSMEDFKNPGKKFIAYLIDKTHVDSVNCLLPKK